jgi:mannose-1-phosphate guanylyltransferase/mannose-6-phosphate isomerase
MLIPLILCGGAGSRLWPVSRESHPKPFIALQDGESFIQKAFLRGAGLTDVAEILTVTNRELFFKVEDAYKDLSARAIPTSYILEPFGRNTAAAIAAANDYVLKTHGPDAVVLVLAADHLIAEHQAFAEEVQNAVALAQQGQIVTFGIRPDAPETGYGYIEAEGHEVLRFVEKPSLELAKQYVAAGNFYWNSGMFCFSAQTMQNALKSHCPEVYRTVSACLAQSRQAKGDGFYQLELHAESFKAVPDISIDYAVMEHAKNMAVVPCSIGWSDIGSWSAISDLVASDARGNRVQGDVCLHEVDNCYIQSSNRLVGAVGVNNLIIVDTPDAILIADKSQSQHVKSIYEQLKAKGHGAHKIHTTVQRPWGSYTILDEGATFKAKRLTVKPGGVLSLQLHHQRSEHWTVVSGMATVTNGEQQLQLGPNQSTYIPVGNKHRLENHGCDDVVLIEVQCGDYFGEDDIVRFQDIYGRV